jgi:hypothetical protein
MIRSARYVVDATLWGSSGSALAAVIVVGSALIAGTPPEIGTLVGLSVLGTMVGAAAGAAWAHLQERRHDPDAEQARSTERQS